MKTKMLEALAIALLLGAGSNVHAGEESFDIDNRFRAKIAKEKVKQAALQRKNDAADRNNADGDDAECGSQNIGTVNTGGRARTAPREVFVFAPNAINLVNGRGCR